MVFNLMNQTCKVCGEPAAGFHFGAFTCEGCKSFFGRSYNNLGSVSECKNSGKCIIDKKNRTTCKACRLRKCYTVGMSKGGSRYGRRSNWFKIHCLLQEQQQQAVDAAAAAAANGGVGGGAQSPNTAAHLHGFGDIAAAAAHHHHHQQQQQQQHHQHHQKQIHEHQTQQSQQRHPHISLLGYPSYLPEPFGRHHAADAASVLPFFSMMAAPQLPPHLLFPSYHPAAAAAADAAYRQEMYKHRQSVDSAGSADSQRYTPPVVRAPSSSSSSASARQSPAVEVCLDDDGEDDVHSVVSQSPQPTINTNINPTNATSTTTTSHPPTHPIVYNPIAIRATPTGHSNSSSPLSFASKMQSLSPVSVCSIGATEVAQPQPQPPSVQSTPSNTDQQPQDGPMDLSMKATGSRSSVHSFNGSDVSSSIDEHEMQLQRPDNIRRKFYHLDEVECSTSSSSDASVDHEAAKRQKLNAIGGFPTHNAANAMRGIFVCV